MIETKSRLSGFTVERMVQQLAEIYISVIQKGASLRNIPSVMLWGPPGVGKSQGVAQIAKRIGEKTGKKVSVTDVRLLLFNPVDLRGIPTTNEDRTLAIWLKPKIFQMDDSSEAVNILFLDEISAAPQSVQAAAHQITLDRKVGEHQLPENCIVIAAGNRVTDRSVAYAMPKALANRLCHMEIVGDPDGWRRWAIRSGIHSIVLGFLTHRPGMLMAFDPTADSLAFPTPRSWEMVSNLLNHGSGKITEAFPMIVGCVGEEAAYELKAWYKVYRTLPKVEDVFAGAVETVPTRPEALLALSSEIASHAGEHHSEEQIRNAVAYASRLPVEFRNRVFADLLQIPSIRGTLSRIYTYDDWFARSGRYWEDYGL